MEKQSERFIGIDDIAQRIAAACNDFDATGYDVIKISEIVGVFFKPAAQEGMTRRVMQGIRGNIVNGPGEYGEYRVAVMRGARSK